MTRTPTAEVAETASTDRDATAARRTPPAGTGGSGVRPGDGTGGWRAVTGTGARWG